MSENDFKGFASVRKTLRRGFEKQMFPVGAMERAAKTHTITVPIANYDDNQQAANENLRLQNLWDGVGTMAALLEIE
jgi:hypothetical protein